MAGLRFQIDLFVPESPTGTLVAGVKIPTALATKIPAIRQAVRDLKAYAVKINEGENNEEMTVLAKYHICHHNENPQLPCEPAQEV
jgi:hypothetical protein